MKKKVLVSAAGTASAWHMINTAKKNFEDQFTVLACDMNPPYLVPASKIADDFIQVPAINEPGYYQYMLNIFLENKVDIFVPLIDFDLELFPCDSEDLKQLGVISTAPTKKVIDLCSDKRKIIDFLTGNQIVCPKVYDPDDIQEEKEYFVKPRRGFGSKNVSKIVGRYVKSIDWSKWLVQELCNLPEVTVEVFFRNNQINTICRERIEVKSGVCTKARIFFDSELNSIIENIATILNLPVASCVQFMKNGIGQWVVTDLNLRIGAGTALSSVIGWDLTSMALSIWGGAEDAPSSFLKDINEERYVVRVFQEMVMI